MKHHNGVIPVGTRILKLIKIGLNDSTAQLSLNSLIFASEQASEKIIKIVK